MEPASLSIDSTASPIQSLLPRPVVDCCLPQCVSGPDIANAAQALIAPPDEEERVPRSSSVAYRVAAMKLGDGLGNFIGFYTIVPRLRDWLATFGIQHGDMSRPVRPSVGRRATLDLHHL